jgi:5,6-dimethylbenzimidazole synthase
MQIGNMETTSNAEVLYQTIASRRDVRREFTGEPIQDAALLRLLNAAHAAPSVGLTQPWDFVIVRSQATRRTFRDHVMAERQTFADTLAADRSRLFAGIKIEGIMESSLAIVVTYDSERGAPDVLGRHAIADAGLYSTCLAIENLWLAATAEGFGVGWVSFYREEFLRDLVGIPDTIRPVAWLCVGPVSHLRDAPDLERHGWRSRRTLHEATHEERW